MSTFNLCALTNSGKVYCHTKNTTAEVIGLSGVQQVTVGNSNCALMSNGTVKCWGQNFSGGLGNGSTVDSLVPVDVMGLSGIQTLVSNGTLNCGISEQGSVKCWGYNLGLMGGNWNQNSLVPIEMNVPSGIQQFALGGGISAYLTASGTVRERGSLELAAYSRPYVVTTDIP